MHRRFVRWTIIATLPIATGTVIALAGPLDPPPGPVTPTGKTLTEVEPRIAVGPATTPGDNDATPSLFKITQPGSYYLTGNIFGASGKIGIEIASGGVTLDLRGFDVSGFAGTLDGIATTITGATNISISNGSVRNWGGDGIDLATSLALNSRVSDIRASGNSGFGIRVGNSFILTRCNTTTNGAGGFSAANQGLVSDCEAVGNGATGFTLGQGVGVSHCASSFNNGAGAAGIVSGGNCTITDCTINSNFGGAGISTGPVSTITACSLSNADADGINTGFGSTISACSVNFSQGVGVVLASGCTITDCSIQFSNLGGIQIDRQCTVRGNTCANNSNGSATGPNIRATGADNRIEGNTCTQAARGIVVEGTGNFIARNICSGNNANNWEVAAGNVCLVVSATTAPAVVGNSGGTAPGSTDPNANFTY